MDQETLVMHRIEDGSKLVEQLAREGFPMLAALWLKASENERWYFYVISPLKEELGPREAYGRLLSHGKGRPRPVWVTTRDIQLLDPSDPIAQDVLAAFRNGYEPPLYPVPWTRGWLGNKPIEMAFLYPLPSVAPSATAAVSA